MYSLFAAQQTPLPTRVPPKKREAGLQAVPERAGGFLEAAVHARAGRRRAVGDDRVERHLQPAA